MTAGIYCLTNNSNGKKYIGKSIYIERRIPCHFNGALKGECENSHLHNAIRKQGEKGFSHKILTSVKRDLYATDEEFNNILSLFERMYIKLYRSKDPCFGYNKTDGGDGCLGRVGSNLGRSFSNEHKSKISSSNLGLKRTESTKKRISEAKKKYYSCGGLNPTSLRVIETNSQLVFNSLKDAARHFDLSRSDVGWCCHKNYNSIEIRGVLKQRLSSLNFIYLTQ